MKTANDEGLSWSKYFRSCIKRDKDRSILAVKSKKCDECAADNLYFEISESLGKEPKEIQKAIAEKWFCHLAPGTQCNGVYDFIAKF